MLPKERLMLIQHVLVPVDLSEYADYALAYAIELAQKCRAALTLLHVIDTTPLGVAGWEAMLPPLHLQDLETRISQRMEAPLGRIHEAGLQGDIAIVQGVPFQKIIDAARDKGADLIVMGTHGRTGLTHVLIGSVAERVVRLAPCPVLVTRQPTAALTQ
jgi:nucleotide-binding universal stress UspA family protein